MVCRCVRKSTSLRRASQHHQRSSPLKAFLAGIESCTVRNLLGRQSTKLEALSKGEEVSRHAPDSTKHRCGSGRPACLNWQTSRSDLRIKLNSPPSCAGSCRGRTSSTHTLRELSAHWSRLSCSVLCLTRGILAAAVTAPSGMPPKWQCCS